MSTPDDHEDGWTEVETDGCGRVVSERRLAGDEAAETEAAYRRFAPGPDDADDRD